MSDQPDLSTLPQRMRYAVNYILQEVFDKDDDLSERYGMALMCDLLDAASKWERAERAYMETVERLAQDLWQIVRDRNAFLLLEDDSAPPPTYIEDAERLYEAGWRKGDPA